MWGVEEVSRVRFGREFEYGGRFVRDASNGGPSKGGARGLQCRRAHV